MVGVDGLTETGADIFAAHAKLELRFGRLPEVGADFRLCKDARPQSD